MKKDDIKQMNENYSGLTQKTVFDFCSDAKVLRFITKQSNLNKAKYLISHNQEERIFDLKLLSFLTDDDNLDRALFDIDPSIIEWDNDVFDFKDTL